MQIMDNAIIRIPRPIGFGYISSGLFTEHGRTVSMPVPFTSSSSIFNLQWYGQAVSAPQRLQGAHIWGGVARSTFGHWITETFPLLACMADLLKAYPKAPVLMMLHPRSAPPHWSDYHHLMVQRIGFELRRIVCIDSDTLVARLIVPEDPFGRRNRYRPAVAAALDATQLCPKTGSGERLFLSRRALPRNRRSPPNIAEIEDRFHAAGYRIIHPETLEFLEQCRVILAASHLAGVNGSALHWSLYSRHLRSVISLGWHLPLQRGICDLRGQEYIRVATRGLNRLKGRNRQRVSMTAVDSALVRVTARG